MEAELIEAEDNLSKLPQQEPWHKGITIDKIVELKITNPNLTQEQASQILNCSKANIIDHLARHNISWRAIKDNLNKYKNNRADILALKGQMLIDNLSYERIKELNVKDSVWSYAVLYDKERLERDKSTSNVGMAELVEHRISLEDASKQALERKEALEAKIAALESANPTAASDTSTDE